jgi:hypothetical protein
MMHQGQRMVVSEIDRRFPVLIIDKKGVLGTVLAEKLKEQFLVVLVCGKEFEVQKNIIHIPYVKKIPLIPDNEYSHIFIIYNGESELLEMLPSFVKKANETRGKLFFISSVTFCNPKLITTLSLHLYHAMQVLLYGEIFDNELREVNEVTFFIHQIRTRERVDIPNEGLHKLYPIYFDDVITGIIAIGFALERTKKILLLLPKSGVTELSIARALQRLNPTIKINFVTLKQKPNVAVIPPEGEYLFPEYNFEERLKLIDFSKRKHVTSSRRTRLHLSRKRKHLRFSLPFFSVLCCLILIPLVTIFISCMIGAWSIQSSVKEAEKAEFTTAKNYASAARGSFSLAQSVTGFFSVFDFAIKEQKDDFIQKLQVGQNAAQTEIDLLNSVLVLQKIYVGKSTDPKNDFFHAIATIKNSLLTLQKMKAEGQLPESIATKLYEMDSTLNYIENTIDTYPSLFGFEGKKKYLVLFQNNMELRPGGGFIGSYGILELENGRMNDFKIADVYDADGKLSTHVEPPYALRRYLGVSHWFLRDSNIDVDFTHDADQAMRFLSLEVGERVDGVIAIDTEFLKNIIAVFGSVSVQGYNETVRPDNFYLLTQTHAEKDFFPGSTQKKDFLRALANTLLTEFSEKKSIPWSLFAKKVGESIQGKHLLFAFSDPAIQKLFTVNNLSSSLWDGRKVGENAILDFFGVIDANVGGNKANFYLRRSLRQDAVIDAIGNMSVTNTDEYENTSTKESQYGGDYKNYVRFLLPQNASLSSIKVDNQNLAFTSAITDPQVYTKKNFVPPTELEVETTMQDDKKIIGFFLIVPKGSTRKVAVSYVVNNAINPQSVTFRYDLRIFKQPGTGADPYSFFLTYPSGYTFVDGSKEIRDVGGKLTYSKNLSEDKTINAEFSKK